MARIEIVDIAHSYNPMIDHATGYEPIYALKRLNLVLEDGKTYALLGPSGCGKTTLLNIISGLLHPSKGRLIFDGIDVTDKKTAERSIAQVFQFPVTYTTMTVAQNLAFPLVCKKFSADTIKTRVNEVAELLGISDLLAYHTKRLTAAQKQLVSMGRGLVRNNVSAILLDEPMTVMDPQVKSDVRSKLKQINREFGTTMLFVTHDQTEAMTFAEQVIVMNDGEVMQRATPRALFEKPDNLFVGYFIGSPPMNQLRALFHDNYLVCPNTAFTHYDLSCGSDAEIYIGFRPEFVELTLPDAANFCVAKVVKIDNLGTETIITTKLSNGEIVRAKKQNRFSGRVGARVGLSVDADKIYVYCNGKRLTVNGQ